MKEGWEKVTQTPSAPITLGPKPAIITTVDKSKPKEGQVIKKCEPQEGLVMERSDNREVIESPESIKCTFNYDKKVYIVKYVNFDDAQITYRIESRFPIALLQEYYPSEQVYGLGFPGWSMAIFTSQKK